VDGPINGSQHSSPRLIRKPELRIREINKIKSLYLTEAKFISYSHDC